MTPEMKENSTLLLKSVFQFIFFFKKTVKGYETNKTFDLLTI